MKVITYLHRSLLLGSLCLLGQPVLAAPSAQDWHEVNLALVDQHILPNYQALEKNTAALADQVNQLCAAPDQARLAETQAAFGQAMGAWQGVQHIQFGPVQVLMRNFSLQYWPDKRNLGGKQLASLLSDKPEPLDNEFFHRASVAVKGLPALERLLFDKQALAKFKQDEYRCNLTSAIAGHVAQMSADIHNEWQHEQRAEFVQASTGNGYYLDDQEAATDLMKALVEPVEGMRDTKLKKAMKASASEARYRQLESWRSGLSLTNLSNNLNVAEFMYQGTSKNVKSLLIAEGEQALANKISAQFAQARKDLDAVKGPLRTTLKDADNYARLSALSNSLRELGQSLEQAMQPLDIQLGFNSRDGD